MGAVLSSGATEAVRLNSDSVHRVLGTERASFGADKNDPWQSVIEAIIHAVTSREEGKKLKACGWDQIMLCRENEWGRN